MLKPTLPAPTPNLGNPMPVAEPGMPGYNGPTQDQAQQIATQYGQTGDYQAAVRAAMGGGGGSPNPYGSDPGYQQALANEQLGLSSSNSALNNLIQQRIVAYGDPGLAAMAGFGLDPQAAAFAKQNYLSGNAELARVDRTHQDNLKAIVNQLASHGLVFSGDTGYQSGREDQNYGNTVYDAQQKALADILGYRTNTLQQQQQLHQSVIDALQNAYQNYLNHPELGGYGGQQAQQTQQAAPAPATSSQFGRVNTSSSPALQALTKQLLGHR